MYSSRGIGRQQMGDRRTNDRDKHMSNRSPYQNSPDINFRSEDRDYDQKGYNERREYKESPKDYGGSSRGGYTPPGQPPPIIPQKSVATPNSYAPLPSNAKPPQPTYSSNPEPKYNSSYDSSRTPKYNPTPIYTPTPISSSSYRPNPPPSNSPAIQPSYGRDPYGRNDPEEPTPAEKIWAQKMEVLFQDVNSIDDLITLKEQYAQKTQNLEAILEKSNLREGEILRNKRRNRDDFKDPAMLELRKMQADIKQKLDEVNKFRVEIDKRIRQYNKVLKTTVDQVMEETGDVIVEKPHNYEAQLVQNSMITTTAADDEEEDEEDEYEYENSTKEYYDPGNHWCRDCDKMVPKINEFFEHLHTKEHWGTANSDLKPWWKPKRLPLVDPYARPQTKTKTVIKGVQFLIPLRGYYCPLCKDYLADNSMAEEHMKGAKHNRIYNRFICLNMDYEHKWNTDKGKALSRHQANERKRTKEEEQKELDKKRKLEEQKLKEEKEAKKRRREEEIKRKEKERDKEERERERDEFKKSKNHTSNSDRFRLKTVTMDLKGDNKSSHKDKDRGRDREREKKRTRIYSSSSDSSPSPPRKKRTYFGDPYKDPKLKQKSFIKLIRLNKSTAKRYHCRVLYKLIEEAKNAKPIIHKKVESKTEITIASSPLKMEIDMNDDDNDNKEIKNFVDGLVENLTDDDHKDDNPTKSGEKVEQNSDKNKDSKTEKESEESQKESVISVAKDSDKCDKQKDNDLMDKSFESEPNLEIDTDPHNDNSNKEMSKESDSNDKEEDEDKSKNSPTNSSD